MVITQIFILGSCRFDLLSVDQTNRVEKLSILRALPTAHCTSVKLSKFTKLALLTESKRYESFSKSVVTIVLFKRSEPVLSE